MLITELIGRLHLLQKPDIIDTDMQLYMNPILRPYTKIPLRFYTIELAINGHLLFPTQVRCSLNQEPIILKDKSMREIQLCPQDITLNTHKKQE